jgi:hypothetical protein
MTRPLRSCTCGAAVVLLVAAAATTACKDRPASGGGPSISAVPPKPDAPPSDAAPPDAGPPPAPTPSIAAQLFVDTSGSMGGFFGASRSPTDAGGMLAAVHEEIASALSESGLSSLRTCTVGDRVNCDGVLLTPAKLANPAMYHELTSRLDRVLSRVPPPSRIDPNRPPPRDALDDARLTMLVTDGMEVAAETPGPAGSTSCASGADPTCVRALLEKRIAEGFGVWLVGVLLPFNGTHFPERNLTSSYFDLARKHVEQLKFDPKNLGVVFAVSSKLGVDGSTGKPTYSYRGYRPLLMFVFSRDAILARGVVSRVVDKLRKAPIQPGKMNSQDTVQSVELAPLAATPVRAARITVVPRPEQEKIFGSAFDPAKLVEFKLGESAAMGSGLSQRVWCGGNGRSMLYVEVQRTGDRLLPAYLVEHVALVADSGSPAPPGSVAPPKPHDGDQILTGLNCAPLSPGPNIEVGFALETQLAQDDSQLERQWWSHNAWSSSDSWQMPERVYQLEDIVLPIVKARVARPTSWGRVVLHVKRD